MDQMEHKSEERFVVTLPVSLPGSSKKLLVGGSSGTLRQLPEMIQPRNGY